MHRLAWIRSRLGSASTHYLLGEAAAKGLVFGAFIFVARHVGSTEFGMVSLYVTAAGLLAVPIGVGLPNAIVRFHFSHQSYADVLGTSLALMAATSAFVGALVVSVSPWAERLVGLPPPLLVLAVFGGIVIAVRTAWLSSLTARTLSGEYAVSQLCEGALFAILAVSLVALTRIDSRDIAGVYSGATAAIGIWALARWRRRPGLTVDSALLLPLVTFSVPMVFHGFAMTGLATLDQIVVNHFLGPAATGNYAFAYRFGMSMVVVSTAFSSAWLPKFLDLVRTPTNDAVIRAGAVRYINIMIAVGTLSMVVLPYAVRILGGSAFADAAKLVPVVVYAYLWFVLYTLVYGYALHRGNTASIATATFAALLVNVGLNYLLIPRVGLIGAALASVAGYAALFALQLAMHRDARRHLPIGGLTVRVALAGVIPIALWLLA